MSTLIPLSLAKLGYIYSPDHKARIGYVLIDLTGGSATIKIDETGGSRIKIQDTGIANAEPSETGTGGIEIDEVDP